MVLFPMVGVAVPVGEMKRQERYSRNAAGEKEDRVEPPLIKAEPVSSRGHADGNGTTRTNGSELTTREGEGENKKQADT